MASNRVSAITKYPQGLYELTTFRVAATIYHLFLAEDNSPELFAQAKRIHSMIPYIALKQVIRFANPALVMSGVLDLFLAQPFGTKSLAQRVFAMALHDGIRSFQKAIDGLIAKIDDPVLCKKIKNFSDASEDVKNIIRSEAVAEDVDLVVVILRSEYFQPELTSEQIGRVFNAYVAWINAVENVSRAYHSGVPDSNSLGRRRDEARCTAFCLPQTASQIVHSATGQSHDAKRHRRGQFRTSLAPIVT